MTDDEFKRDAARQWPGTDADQAYDISQEDLKRFKAHAALTHLAISLVPDIYAAHLSGRLARNPDYVGTGGLLASEAYESALGLARVIHEKRATISNWVGPSKGGQDWINYVKSELE